MVPSRNSDVVRGPARTARVDEIFGVLQTRQTNSDVVVGIMRVAKIDEILGVLRTRLRNSDVA